MTLAANGGRSLTSFDASLNCRNAAEYRSLQMRIIGRFRGPFEFFLPPKVPFASFRRALMAPLPSFPPNMASISSITKQFGLAFWLSLFVETEIPFIDSNTERISTACFTASTRPLVDFCVLAALISTTLYPACFAAMCASVVLPAPGPPETKAIFFIGLPDAS